MSNFCVSHVIPSANSQKQSLERAFLHSTSHRYQDVHVYQFKEHRHLTSSSVLKGTMQVTGPNTSSCMSRLLSATSVMAVGLMKYPPLFRGGSSSSSTPCPHRTLQPSSLASCTKPVTLARCSLLISAPIMLEPSLGSPTFTFLIITRRLSESTIVLFLLTKTKN